MPCTYIETAEEIAARNKAANAKLIKPYKEKLDQVTRLLCWLCSVVISDSGDYPEGPYKNELAAWHKRHEAADLERENARIKKQALAKLSAREKAALGIQ